MIAPDGESAAFAGDLISNLPPEFTGILDISASSPFLALTLRALSNSRGQFLVTTFPIADLNRPAPAPIVFPQVADGDGGGFYRTEFIFLGNGESAGATLDFYGDEGATLSLEYPGNPTAASYGVEWTSRSGLPFRECQKGVSENTAAGLTLQVPGCTQPRNGQNGEARTVAVRRN